MSEVRIAAEPRTEFGKGGARRTRRAGKVPAVLYGHGKPPRHIALPAHDLLHAFKTNAGTNVLLTLELADGTELALAKDVQRHPIKGSFEHIDLVLVNRGEKVVADIQINVIGEPHPDTLVDQQAATIAVKADATLLPGPIEVDITGLEPGTAILARQVALPEGSELDADPDTVIVQCLAKRTTAQVESDLGETSAEGSEEAAAAGASA
ncbi:50S ribosomal protein L25/general stress protein Ctc [Frankia sp. AgB32]|uniref:50S ribosomal protein L25/general stress protein Ctc n=1 Tax=Frankia sp. AgB32 TaxID=631119 RepID=UPI00200BEB59|nr:50S ribosomal protein L25/general stress protein Ctc [Frankia sp. AgB32]MCK9893167.1 50S ribosomal protein L25/general stress protein Ctc [Frankia sp. AgB32]